jgi:5-formyltetrahydrofolate cyclo-ligase
MEFVELDVRQGQRRNRHSIPEPRVQLHRRIDPRLIDIVFVPVVAFDTHGWRLGFGAGFYDRKFAFLRRGFRRKPILIGVGYEFQRLPQQVAHPWDVLLDYAVTERGVQRCKR